MYAEIMIRSFIQYYLRNFSFSFSFLSACVCVCIYTRFYLLATGRIISIIILIYIQKEQKRTNILHLLTLDNQAVYT